MVYGKKIGTCSQTTSTKQCYKKHSNINHYTTHS